MEVRVYDTLQWAIDTSKCKEVYTLEGHVHNLMSSVHMGILFVPTNGMRHTANPPPPYNHYLHPSLCTTKP